MRITDLTCKNCHGVMEVKEDEDKIVCPFCGTTNWIVENDEIRRDKARYRFLNENEKTKADFAYKRDIAQYKFLRFKYIFIAAAVVAAIVFLIVVINNARKNAKIPAPASASQLIGKQYSEVEKLFSDAGFLNIETNAVADLQNGFLYNAKNDEGKVSSVSIGGSNSFVVNEGFVFRHTDYFDKKDQVRITYRTMPKPTQTPEEIAADNSVNADWTEKPVILSAHETGKDQFTIEWRGKSPVYIVRVDGVQKAVVDDTSITFKLDNGLHFVQIIPINRETQRNDIPNINGSIKINAPVNFDLAKYNMNRDHLVAGLFSDEIRIDYSSEKIYDMMASEFKASVDLQNAVHLSFIDPSDADGYLISYRTGNEESTVIYEKTDESTARWITADGDSVKIVVDSDFLQTMGDPAILPDRDYSFTVTLLKNSMDYVGRNKTNGGLLASRSSNVNIKTTPVWKDAPVITFGGQTADGEITIRWTHPGAELGCQYVISQRSKTAFITTGETELLKVTGAEVVIKDLQNGTYTLTITPENNGEKGVSSAEYTVTVNNNWSQAPEFVLSQVDARTAKVEITHIYGIEKYCIKVFCGDNGNLLKIVNMDFSLYGEYNVEATSPVTEFVFKYEKESKPTDEIKVKFEIYGINISEDGTEQHSAVRAEQIILKPE